MKNQNASIIESFKPANLGNDFQIVTDVKTRNPMKTTKRFRAAAHGPWFYISPMEENSLSNKRIESIDYLSKFVTDTYMKNIFTIDIGHVDTRPNNFSPNDIISDILRESRRILKYAKDHDFVFKAKSEDISIYCLIKAIDDDIDQLGIVVLIYDDTNMILSGHVIYGSISNSSVFDVSGPVTMSVDKRAAELMTKTFILNMPDTHNGAFCIVLRDLTYFQSAVKNMRKKFDTGASSIRANHTPMEMFAITTLYQKVSGESMISTCVNEWVFKKDAKDDLTSSMIDFGYVSASRHTDSNPLVDLSEREFSYIDKYVKEKHYLIPDDQEGPSTHLNMHQVVLNSRYGSSFLYPITINNEKITSQLFFKLANEDIATLTLTIPIGDIMFVLSVLFDNMRDFNMYSNIVTITLCAAMLDRNNIPSSADEMDSKIPAEFDNLEYIVPIIYRICAMFITIYERPERTRVVRETRTRNTEGGKPDNKRDYVIRRILKTTSAAKRYITRMSGTCTDREYTMESWNRVGHTRQLKSGRIVYVHECECKRRLPLSDKEIHLKL